MDYSLLIGLHFREASESDEGHSTSGLYISALFLFSFFSHTLHSEQRYIDTCFEYLLQNLIVKAQPLDFPRQTWIFFSIRLGKLIISYMDVI